MGARLLADAQLGDNGAVTLDVLPGEVVEQTAALADHLVHAETAVVVLRVLLQMLGELADALGEDGDLDLRRTGVALVGGVVQNDGGLLLLGDHAYQSFLFCKDPAPECRGERAPRTQLRGRAMVRYHIGGNL